MQLHTLIPPTKQKRPRRIGRGGKRGTYAGRGIKGQRSRAGARIRPAIRDYIKQLPKLRGYSFGNVGKGHATVSLGELARAFPAGSRIDTGALLRAHLVKRRGGRIPSIKVLGDGKISHPLHLHALAVSGSAREKVESAGGTIHA